MIIKIVDRYNGLIDTIQANNGTIDELVQQLESLYTLNNTFFGITLVKAQNFDGYIYTNSPQYFHFDE